MATGKLAKKENLKIIELEADKLVRLEGNPRRIVDPVGIKRLVKLIKKHGFQNPLQVYKEKKGTYTILCGNHRFEAGKVAGIKVFPCIEYKGTRKMAMARALSDNKAGEWTDWDYPLLKDFIGNLDDGDFNLELTGFSSDEIESFFEVEDKSNGASATGDRTGYYIYIQCENEKDREHKTRELEGMGFDCHVKTIESFDETEQ